MNSSVCFVTNSFFNTISFTSSNSNMDYDLRLKMHYIFDHLWWFLDFVFRVQLVVILIFAVHFYHSPSHFIIKGGPMSNFKFNDIEIKLKFGNYVSKTLLGEFPPQLMWHYIILLSKFFMTFSHKCGAISPIIRRKFSFLSFGPFPSHNLKNLAIWWRIYVSSF